MKRVRSRGARGILIPIAVIAIGLFLLLWAGRAAVSSANDGDEELWRSSAVQTGDIPLEQLSPPDSATARSGPEPQAPEGVTLRDFRLPGSVLRPRASSVGVYWGAGGGCIYNSSGNPAEILNAPVTLPEGATINTVRMYYNDGAEGNATGWFSIYDLYGALVQEWSMTSSGDSGNGFNDTPIVDHTIDYSVYSYALNWRPTVQGTEMQLCGFRIFYEPPPFGLSFLPWASN